MFKVVTILLIGLAVGLIAPSAWAQDSCVTQRVSIDGDFGAGEYLPAGTPVQIPIRITNLNCNGDKFAISSSWLVYSPDGATWQNAQVVDQWIHLDPPISGYPQDIPFSYLFTAVFYEVFPGNGEDSVGFAGIVGLFDPGLFDGLDHNGLAISLTIDQSSVGKTICVDKLANEINGYEWEWTHSSGNWWVYPEWNGPYCFEIVECGDVNGNGGFDISDMTAFVDHLFGSGGSINAPAANVDWCDGTDIADLVLFQDYFFGAGAELCSPDWICSPQLPDDAVRLEMVHRPNVATADYGMRVDLTVHQTVPVTAASMGLTWDNSGLTLDSIVTTPEVASLFDQGLSTQVDQANQRVKIWGLDSSPNVNGSVQGVFVTWASLYFSANTWNPGDSVTFDLAEWDDGSKLKFAIPPSEPEDYVGFVPRFDGPLVVRDAGDYGDINGSGGVDSADIIDFTNYILSGAPLGGPADMGNVDMCDGTDIADLFYLIEQVNHGAPPLNDATCDYEVPGDSVGMRFTSVPGWGEGNAKAMAGEPLALELLVSNTEAVFGATMGFEWSARNLNNPGGISHLNLQLDSAKGTALTITGFDAGIEFYEGGSRETSNSNSHFQFAGTAVAGSSGIAGDVDKRLWATYFFTLNNWEEGDEILIDTTEYSDGTTFKMVSGALGGHGPGWDPDIIFDCCGSPGGMTGNVSWENDVTHFRCDLTGKANLADITRLIDFVYISHEPLCCRENGNVDGDIDSKINLADITRLIDHVYISKQETAPCL